MRERTGKRGSDDLVGTGGDRDGWRNIVENQQRRYQEATANPEHSGQKSDRRTHAENDEGVNRNLGDGQVDRHSRPERKVPK